MIEKVQERAVNMVVGLRSKDYSGKLRELKLTTLQERRIRGDMIQTWKYLHNQNPGGEKLFKRSEEQHARSSRHTTKPLNICVPNSRLDIRKNFYTSRCVGRWHSLPHEVQNAEELNGF